MEDKKLLSLNISSKNLSSFVFNYKKRNGKCVNLTDFSEWSQLLPARDEGAGAGQAVTLTSHLHAVNNRLGLAN